MKESAVPRGYFSSIGASTIARRGGARLPPELLHRDLYQEIQSLKRKWLGQNMIGAIPGGECQQIWICRNSYYFEPRTRRAKLRNHIEDIYLFHHDICD